MLITQRKEVLPQTYSLSSRREIYPPNTMKHWLFELVFFAFKKGEEYESNTYRTNLLA